MRLSSRPVLWGRREPNLRHPSSSETRLLSKLMTPSTTKTIYLGRNRPLLHSAIDYLWSQCAVVDSGAGPEWDLSGLLIVLPTARSRRRLNDLLANHAELNGCTMNRPRLITSGELPQELFKPELELASELEQTLAWAQALTDTSDKQLSALLSNLPPREPLNPWIELAATINSLHIDLAAGELDFADVEREVVGEAEQKRWRLLSTLHKKYLKRLKSAGRVDPFLARRDAIRNRQCQSSVDIVLIGTADLSRSVTSMLRAVAESGRVHSGSSGGAITALVAAEEQLRDHFDAFGSIIASQWIRYELPLRDDQLIAAQDVADQANTAANIVEKYGGTYSFNDITLGVTHESLVGPIEFELRSRNIASYRELGWTIPQTPIGRLLELLGDHLSRHTWRTMAALVRHADLHDFISNAIRGNQSLKPTEPQALAASDSTGPKALAASDSTEPKALAAGLTKPTSNAARPEASAYGSGNKDAQRDAYSNDWLTALDGLIANHYPTRCDNELPPAAIQSYPAAIAVRNLIQDSIRDLRGPTRTLSDWAGRVNAWLTEIYFSTPLAPGAPHTRVEGRGNQAISAVTKFLIGIQELEKSLDVKVSAAAALEMLTARLAAIRVSDTASRSGSNQTGPPTPAAGLVKSANNEVRPEASADGSRQTAGDHVTVAGWLDLALDDSAAMVITSLNHPYVPEAITADPFLPGSLRTRLQLNDNERRLARDIHSLDVILSSRREITLIVGARSLDGSPTPPSRLFAAAKPLDAARRLVELLEPKPRPSKPTPKSSKSKLWMAVNDQSQLPIPVLPADRPVKSMSVTAFKAYLDCPYRFYLRHVLHLKPLDDASGELQANQFGDLIHNTLDWFGKSTLKDSTNQAAIETALHETLDKYAAHFFGSAPNAAVRLQIEQARDRLSFVAIAQSERRRAGWRIHDVETPFGETELAGIQVDQQWMPIRGRIDRIDQHDDGRWAIIDYKTHGHVPRTKHLKTENGQSKWIDLQLPLYQLLIPAVLGEGIEVTKVSLSYFSIGDNLNETKINDADFSATEYMTAKQSIFDCIRRIRRSEFLPAKDVLYDDYAMILQTGSVAALFDRLVGD